MDDETTQQSADATNNNWESGSRDNGGRFKPGHAGRGGRRRGSRNKVTALAEVLIAGEAEGLVRKAIGMAMAGNATCLTALLRCLVPPMRETSMPIRFRLPPLVTANDALDAIACITEGVARGDLDSDGAKTLTALVAEFRATLEAVNHARRLRELEARLEQRK